MAKDIDRLDRVVRFVGEFIIQFSALMPIVVVLFKDVSGKSGDDLESGLLSLRDDSARIEAFRDLILNLPDGHGKKKELLDVAEKCLELCRFRAVLAHGILSGDRLHDDPEIIPNFFHSQANFKRIRLSEDIMARHMRQLIELNLRTKSLLPTGVKIDLGGHSMIIEELGGKSAEEIFEDLGLPLNERDKGGKRVSIKFIYSVSRTVSGCAILQRHKLERIQRVSGDPDQYGMPTIRQLHIAERDFLEQWRHFEPNGYLITFEAVPADGTPGLFSEYRAMLPA